MHLNTSDFKKTKLYRIQRVHIFIHETNLQLSPLIITVEPAQYSHLRITTQFNGVRENCAHFFDKAKKNTLYFTVDQLVSWSSYCKVKKAGQDQVTGLADQQFLDR